MSISDYCYMERENSYEVWAEQLHQDHLEDSYNEFFAERKEAYIASKEDGLSENQNSNVFLWEVE